MNETEFNLLADDLMLAIEDAIDDSGANIDFETVAGVLTLTMEENNSKVIISRQPAMAQIWVAAKSGGFHLDLEADTWVCSSTDETLQSLLNRVCGEQSDEVVELDF